MQKFNSNKEFYLEVFPCQKQSDTSALKTDVDIVSSHYRYRCSSLVQIKRAHLNAGVCVPLKAWRYWLFWYIAPAVTLFVFRYKEKTLLDSNIAAWFTADVTGITLALLV